MDNSSSNNSMVGTEEVIEGSHGGPYMVEKIVGIYMGKDGKKYFRVKWLDSWEPAENLSEGCQQLIDDFMSGASSTGKSISNVNLQLGQVIIKTEEMLSPTTKPLLQVSSSGIDSMTNLSSTTQVTSSNKKRNSSSNQKKKNNNNQNENNNNISGNIMQNKSSPLKTKKTIQTVNISSKVTEVNQQPNKPNKKTPAKSQSRKKTNQNKKSPNSNRKKPKDNPIIVPIPSQNRLPAMSVPMRNMSSTQYPQTTVMVESNEVSTFSNRNLNEAPNSSRRPTQQIRNSSNSQVKLPEKSKTNALKSISQNITCSDEMKSVDQRTKLLQSLQTNLLPSHTVTSSDEQIKKNNDMSTDLLLNVDSNLLSSFRDSQDANLSNETNLSSPKKKCELPEKTEAPTLVQTKVSTPLNSQVSNEEDDGEKETKSLINTAPVKKSTSSEEEEENDSTEPTSSSYPHPSEKHENLPDPMSTNNIAIKMASPPTVVSGEAASTVDEGVDSDEGMKMSGEMTSAKKQLNFDNPEFIPKTTDEPSPPTTVQTQSLDNNSSSNSPLTIPTQSVYGYQDRHNVIYSSPPRSYYSESEYNREPEQVDDAGDKVIIDAEIENYDDASNYLIDEEEETNLDNYNENINTGQQQMHFNLNQNSAQIINDESSSSYPMDTVENNLINLDDDNVISDNEQEVYEAGVWNEESMCSNQGNDYETHQYENPSEDVIALDSDDDNDLEIIVSIDSPKTRRRGRLPVSQPAKRGRPSGTGTHSMRGAHNTSGGHITTLNSNDQNEFSPNQQPTPLVHPRLMLSGPHMSTEEPQSQPIRGGRGRGRGVTMRGNTRQINTVTNTNVSPMQQNIQNGPNSPASSEIVTTPSRKRQRIENQTTPQSSSHLNSSFTTPTSTQNRNRVRTPQTTPTSTSSPCDSSSPRSILNDRTCTICNQAFPNLTLARQHAKQAHLQRQVSSPSTSQLFSCNVCNAMFKSNTDLQSHMSLHDNNRKNNAASPANLHKCDVCFRGFKQRSVLMQHLMIHADELPYACVICEKRFKQQSHLVLHLGTHGRNNEGTYQCPHCSVEFNDDKLFAEHMREHDAELPFQCNFCQLRFELKSNLMLHLQGHNEGRPFTCHICKKSFKKKTYYFGHMQMHKIKEQENEEKPGDSKGLANVGHDNC